MRPHSRAAPVGAAMMDRKNKRVVGTTIETRDAWATYALEDGDAVRVEARPIIAWATVEFDSYYAEDERETEVVALVQESPECASLTIADECFEPFLFLDLLCEKPNERDPELIAYARDRVKIAKARREQRARKGES